MARFPEEGLTLEAFGLNCSRVTHLTVPNDLAAWPTTALNSCVNIETISVYGEESNEGLIDLELAHGFRNLTKLKTLHFPSTIKTLGNGVNTGPDNYYGIFPTSLQSVLFSKNILKIGWSFVGTQLTHVDLSHCTQLMTLGNDARGSDGPFFECLQLRTVLFPSSLQNILNYAFAQRWGVNNPLQNLKIIVWVGRTMRASNINRQAFCSYKTLDQLVSEGTITEIFIP